MDRLLSYTDFSIDNEIKDLEILKTLFGESSLSACEVMLKDISDSKRTDTRFQTIKQQEMISFRAMVLSHHFWPRKFQTYDIPKIPAIAQS